MVALSRWSARPSSAGVTPGVALSSTACVPPRRFTRVVVVVVARGAVVVDDDGAAVVAELPHAAASNAAAQAPSKSLVPAMPTPRVDGRRRHATTGPGSLFRGFRVLH